MCILVCLFVLKRHPKELIFFVPPTRADELGFAEILELSLFVRELGQGPQALVRRSSVLLVVTSVQLTLLCLDPIHTDENIHTVGTT